MKRIIMISGILFSSVVVLTVPAMSQGCIIIKNMAGFGQFAQLGYGQTEEKWMMNISARYFESVTPFKDNQQIAVDPDPTKRNINYNTTVDLSVFRILNDGWGIGLALPISSNTLVSRAEHMSGDRHSTHAVGLGDIRVTVYKWLRKQENDQRWNVQAGVGLKLPTGDYHYQDYYYNDPVNKNSKVLAPVDPSLQLGDGGTGITGELNAYYNFSQRVSLYGNIFYLVSPRDQNGVSNLKDLPPAPYAEEATLTVNTVADNYTLRFGGNFTFLNKIVASAGVRLEGVPKYDLLGENHGLRRVGHVASLEIGLQYKLKKSFFFGFVPIAFDRRLRQSVPDEMQSELSGTYSTTAGRIPEATMIFGYAFVF
jgi:hypothetical protein